MAHDADEPNHPYELSGVLQDLGQHAEALEALDATLVLVPDSAVCHVGRAVSLRALGRRREALDALYRARRLDPALNSALRDLVDLLGEMRRWSEAAESALELMARQPAVSVASAAGNGLFQLGRLEEAERILRHGQRLDPHSVDLQAALANVLDERGDHSQGERLLRDAVRANPDDAFLQSALSMMLLRAGRAKEAFELASRTCEQHPDSSDAQCALAYALSEIGESPRAVRTFQRALEIAPDSPEKWAGLAMTLGILDRHHEALEAFDRLLAIDPGYFDWYGNAPLRELYVASASHAAEADQHGDR